MIQQVISLDGNGCKWMKIWDKKLTVKIIGAFIVVANEHGSGYLKSACEKALVIFLIFMLKLVSSQVLIRVNPC